MITLRYHTVSLAAILLTLGLGIWIGTAIGSPGLTSQQTALINESNVKFDQEVAVREQDEKMLDENRQALAGLVPHFTHLLLYGKHIAIIRTGDYPDATQNATDALAQTGATISSSITITDQFDVITAKERRDILGPVADEQSGSANAQDNSLLFARLVLALKSGAIQHPDIQDSIDRMSASGLITFSGEFSQPVDLIIVVGGSSADPGEIEASDDQERERTVLTALLSSAGFPTAAVIGCEPTQVGTSSVPVYQQAGIGSVDCIDEPLGALDLVYALHGEAASYGVKSGSTLLAPASLMAAGGSS